MSKLAALDLSVVLPFADHEDVIGTAVRGLASTSPRARSRRSRSIAVDEDSGDNSHAVLGSAPPEVPELPISNAPGRGRGIASALVARGRALG